MIRAVLATEVLVAALISPRGAPANLLLSWRGGAFELIVSPLLLDELEYEVEANAPLFTLAPPAAPTAKDRAAAEGSPQAAAFVALVRAVAAGDPPAIAGAISAAYLERRGGESVAQYSVGSDLPSGTARPVRVVETGDRASLYLETEDEKGIVRFVQEQGGWRVDRQKWTSE